MLCAEANNYSIWLCSPTGFTLENISLEMFSIFEQTIATTSFALTMSCKLKMVGFIIKEIYQTEIYQTCILACFLSGQSEINKHMKWGEKKTNHQKICFASHLGFI